jgi:hypothetical protein
VGNDVSNVLCRRIGRAIDRHVGPAAAPAAALATALGEPHVVTVEFDRRVAEGLAVVDAEDRPTAGALEGSRNEASRRRDPP